MGLSLSGRAHPPTCPALDLLSSSGMGHGWENKAEVGTCPMAAGAVPDVNGCSVGGGRGRNKTGQGSSHLCLPGIALGEGAGEAAL